MKSTDTIELSAACVAKGLEPSFASARGAALVLDELLELVLEAQHPIAAARVDGCEALLISGGLAEAVVHARANLLERMRALELAFEMTAAPRQ
ncbi:MAG: hypothetical protein RL268_1881 [Pseudomonadota bacterium]